MQFRDKIHRQALDARREMLRTGKLLSQGEFCARLHISEATLRRLVVSGSVFSIDIDGTAHYPTLLTSAAVDRARLQSVCRLLVPAPPIARMIYMSSAQGNLGGRSPIEALQVDASYRLLRQMARAWAAEWSRTTVKIYAGGFITEPVGIEPTYIAVDEIDPRTNIWKRAASAMKAGGFLSAPKDDASTMGTATVFVVVSTFGGTPDALQARLDIRFDTNIVKAHVVMEDGSDFDVDGPPATRASSIASIVYQLVNTLRATTPQARTTGKKSR